MAVVGQSVFVRGEVQASGDLRIEGRIEGPVLCETAAVTVAEGGCLIGSVIARDVTVFGNVEGTLIALDVVDIRPGATVTGRVVSKRFILAEGATFHGTAAPQQLEAALRIARHRHQIRDEAADQPAPRRAPMLKSLSQR
ncbi:MAG: polymer-forming cytoskeletal protein [Vicinamibacterales bacterium]